MSPTPKAVQRTYYLLTLLSTLAASFIWGINTLFLLDAGLSNTAAFAVNAFFTGGQVLFEVPTGVVADTRGRRTSYALGAITLLITTVAYWWLWQIQGPFWAWAVVSALLGLGFTFFSGATEAWLVDALKFTGFTGKLENVFARGQMIGGGAMLTGSVAGGFIAQVTDLGVPYLIRAGLLGATLAVSLAMMRDWGFAPQRGLTPMRHVRSVLTASINNGFRKPPVRWMMLSAPFIVGVSFYAFYAMQPFLLELYGESGSYAIAGLAAAIVAGAQIVGGLLVTSVVRRFKTRTAILITTTAAGVAALAMLAIFQNFWFALGMIVLWGLFYAISLPVRQAYMNGLIESEHRATVLSFDSLMGSAGGIFQPGLGKVADVYSYATSYLASAIVQAGALPFILKARARKPASDLIESTAAESSNEPLPVA